MRYRYITFDCYGTLVDWRKGIESGLHVALGNVHLSGQDLLKAYVQAERNEEADYKRYREVLRLTVISMSGVLGVKVSDKAARRFSESVPDWPPFEDTAEFLRLAGRRGYKRYILSNVDDDILEETIKKHGLELDGFVTAQEVGSYKPNPGHWLEFMQKTGAKKVDVLHVAQSVYHDIIPCQRMGIDSAWVNRYNERMPPGSHPTYIADSLAQLAELLDARTP